MSKELEALSLLVEKSIYGNKENNRGNIFQAEKTIKQALTPPTEEEVCKALSEWLKEEIPDLWNCKVYHDDGGFHYYNNQDYEIYLVDYDEIFERIFFPRYLPPYLIELVAKYYKGEIK